MIGDRGFMLSGGRQQSVSLGGRGRASLPG